MMAFFFAGCEPKSAAPEFPTPSTRSLSVPFQTSEWNTPFGRGQCLATRHYRIYTTVQDSSLLATLPGFMEAAYQNYRDILGLDFPDATPAGAPLPMYLLASRAEWEAMTVNRFGQVGPAGVVEDGGYTVQGVTVCWAIGGTATFSVASHEGMHQFLYHALKDRLPLWAEEGLAAMAEGFVLDRGTVRFTPDQNLMRLSDLRTAILNGYWLDLPTLLTTNTAAVARSGGQGKAVGYYGQLYALASFLRRDETCGPKWRTMLREAREGNLGAVLPEGQQNLRGPFCHQLAGRTLFEHYITGDLEAFEVEFRSYARRLVRLPPQP